MLRFNLQAAILLILCFVQSIFAFSPRAAALALGPTLPGDDPFYTPPAGFEKSAPGTLLRNRPVPQPLSTFTLDAAYQVLYRTTDSFGKAIVTVTTILVPPNARPDKLLSYQVAEDAANPNCAPSYVFQKGSQTGGLFGTITTQAEMGVINNALKNGWYVTVPDFLGPKSAFLANNLAGFAVLDGIRATLASSSFSKIAKDPAVAIWGYSGGSLATGFAAEFQPCYAPELKIVGAALGGTCPNILSVLYTINKSLYSGLIATGILGLSNEYPEVDALIKAQLKPEKASALDGVRKQCLGAAVLSFMFQDVFTYVKDPTIFNSTIVKTVVAANNMGQQAPSIPLMIYKGAKDEISPVADTDTLVDWYCNGGSSVEYRRIASAGHLGLLTSYAPDAISWLKDRLDGKSGAKGCVKKDQSEATGSNLNLEDLLLHGQNQ